MLDINTSSYACVLESLKLRQHHVYTALRQQRVSRGPLFQTIALLLCFFVGLGTRS